MLNFFDLSFSDLEHLVQGHGKEKFRAHQIFKWVYIHGVYDFDQMTNLSKALREELRSLLEFRLPQEVEFRQSVDGTQKYLFDVGDGRTVESVLIPSDQRRTLCVSSEVGCNMACTFCYTGKQKLKKRLTAGQIIGQLLQVMKRQEEGKNVTNIVFMGMGEPLDNCEEVFKAISVMHDDRGINLSRRKITVSTSGLVDQMPLVAEAGVRLAVSLNAPNDEIRNEIMPINRKYPLEVLMEACRTHAKETRDRVTFEYVLLKDLNDQVQHARQVYQWVKDVPCKVNLIPFNEHPDSGYLRPGSNKTFAFQKYLLDRGIHTTVRKTMGRDIFAACGQLTSLVENKPRFQPVETGVLG